MTLVECAGLLWCRRGRRSLGRLELFIVYNKGSRDELSQEKKKKRERDGWSMAIRSETGRSLSAHSSHSSRRGRPIGWFSLLSRHRPYLHHRPTVYGRPLLPSSPFIACLLLASRCRLMNFPQIARVPPYARDVHDLRSFFLAIRPSNADSDGWKRWKTKRKETRRR